MDLSILMLMIVVGGPVYFLPLLMARHKGHKHEEAIGFINVFLGWTVVGWVFALALTSSCDDRSRMKQCVACRDFIVSFAVICPHCQTPNTTRLL